MTTPKQDRNGVPGPGATGGNVAQPGPDATAEIRAAKASAETKQAARKSTDHLQVPPDRSVVPWDSAIATRKP
jgi:hypothetical protein